MNLEKHPGVIAYRKDSARSKPETVSTDWLKGCVMEAGADDVGVVGIDRNEIADQKPFILDAFPTARTLISIVIRMNTPQVQSRERSLIDGEFIAVEEHSLSVSRKLIRRFREKGISCITPSEGFPQDMSRWPGRMFTVSHKPVAQAAGLGKIGHHRLLIHPEFGSHLCLSTLIIDTAVDEEDGPLAYNPCIGCNLCAATCPTGAISKDGSFDFLTCLVHAYRDRLGGFINWTESLVTSNTMEEYREKRSDSETLAVWQSLTYKGGYRCGYCMSVCPAGVDVIGDYLDRRKDYLKQVVKPLQNREENVYVFPGSKAETSLTKRLPRKRAKPV